MKKVSVFVKGDRSSTAYYRIYQYFDKIKNISCSYRIMYPKWVVNNFMPIGARGLLIKVFAYIIAYFRVLLFLLEDAYIKKPDYIVVHKRIITRIMPFSYYFLLKKCKQNGTKLFWDFDDDIISGKEMSKRSFDFFSNISDRISVTHNYLKSMINTKYHAKTHLLPTTDGDMYIFGDDKAIMSDRVTSLYSEVRLVWVGTSGNLVNFDNVIPQLEIAAEKLYSLYKKQLYLYIVCDKPLKINTLKITTIYFKWTRRTAIEVMKKSHIGIMPLKDIEYNKGKGGFKLVQYLSIGLPCIGSHVGFNCTVINKDSGFLIKNESEWVDSILRLSNIDVWEHYSTNAFVNWKSHFSYNKNLDYWESLFLNVYN